jgi:hypothetical protein
MSMRNLSNPIILFCVVIGVFASVCVFWIIWKTHETGKLFKPYASYAGLVNLASGFDDYKKQNGAWPTNITQLVEVRPDLGNATNDAYGHAVILIPYSEKAGYGEVISYGRDGRSGGDNQFDRDLMIRFPMEMETNAQWNQQVADRFKSRASRGLW